MTFFCFLEPNLKKKCLAFFLVWYWLRLTKVSNCVDAGCDGGKLLWDDGLTPFDFGIGLNIGEVMFGNIGVASRLSFSVIGPTINEVERIETLTKAVDAQALATKEIAAVTPEDWTSIGEFQLKGVAGKTELFAFNEVQATVAEPMAEASEKAMLMN